MKKLLYILLFLPLGLSAQTVWHVTEDGDDLTGNGTTELPFATAAVAAGWATTPGDTIYVHGGTYAETAQIIKALGVHIFGDGQGVTVINSTYASTYTGSITCASAEGNPVNDGGSISNLTLTGNNYTGRIGIYGAYRSNISVHDCSIFGFIYGAIKIKSNNADVFTAPTVNYATGWEIIDNDISDCGYLNSSYASLWFDGTDGMEIRGNTFIDTARAPGSNAWATIKCTFNTGFDINGNTFYREDHENGRFNFFMECWNYEGGCQFRDNILHGLATVDLGGAHNQMKAGYTYGAKVTGNQFLNSANGNYTNGGNSKTIIAINIEGSGHDSVDVSRNLIQRYGYGIEIATASSIGGVYAADWTLDDIFIDYNLMTNLGYADYQYCYGILVLNETNTGEYTTTMNNFRFRNNTMTAMTGSTYQGIRLSCNGTLTGFESINNIITDFDSYGVYLGEHSTDGFDLTNADVTYNCMNGNGTNTVGIDGDISQTSVDVSTGNITDDPLFTSSSDFTLQTGSPCLDTGTDVDLTSDYLGNTVPSGDGVDMGAYEKQVAAPEPAAGGFKKSGNKFMRSGSGFMK